MFAGLGVDGAYSHGSGAVNNQPQPGSYSGNGAYNWAVALNTLTILFTGHLRCVRRSLAITILQAPTHIAACSGTARPGGNRTPAAATSDDALRL